MTRVKMARLLVNSLLLVGVAALLGIAGPAQAVPITGSVGFGGGFTPVDELGNQVALGSATGIDFGNAIAVSTTGDLASSIIPFATLGTFTDFQFSPALDPSPVNPLWAAGTFQFILEAVSVVDQNDQFLNLGGTGTMSGAAFEDTAYAWTFSGDTVAGGTFTFSQTNSTAPLGVSEPGTTFSLIFLGLGVLGICAWDRRRPRTTGR